MTEQIQTALAGVATALSGFIGWVTLPLLAIEVSPSQLPPWAQWMLGPLGALVGMVIVVKWLSDRLNKAEEKADRREEERDQDRKALIIVLEQNSSVLRDVKSVMKRTDRHENH